MCDLVDRSPSPDYCRTMFGNNLPSPVEGEGVFTVVQSFPLMGKDDFEVIYA
jgi:hypothetical protein